MAENYFCDTVDEGAQVGLLALMTGISEDYWCAGWMSGLELSCWKARNEGPLNYGRGVITQRQCDLLRLLSEQADGWWTYDNGPVFVRLAQWQDRVARLTTPSHTGD
jgi:hypothetical protein